MTPAMALLHLSHRLRDNCRLQFNLPALFLVLGGLQRLSSGTPAMYSSTFPGAPLAFVEERRLPDFIFSCRYRRNALPTASRR